MREDILENLQKSDVPLATKAIDPAQDCKHCKIPVSEPDTVKELLHQLVNTINTI